MATAKDNLERFRLIGDDAVDRIAAELWPSSPDDPPFPLGEIGRWEPGQPMSRLPQEIQSYLNSSPGWPTWANTSRLLSAQEAYDRRRLRARLVLAHYSLPIVYLYAESSLTLTLTGQLLSHPRRRLLETVRFVEAVMKPGSFSVELNVKDNGLLWVRKVRMTHALVRTMIKMGSKSHKRPSDRTAAADPAVTVAARVRRLDRSVRDNMPLDQLELAFVLQTFGWVLIDGLARFGKSLSTDEARDHLHAWSMIGYALGVTEELLPESGPNAPDAEWLHRRVRYRLLANGDPLGSGRDRGDTWLSGRLLTASLVTILTQIVRERIPDPYRRWVKASPWLDQAMQPLPRTLIRRFCGTEVANYLRIGRAPLIHWLVGEVALRLIDIDAAADYPLDDQPTPRGHGFALPAYLSLP